MGKYSLILWDIDGTLLNFHAAQSVAIRRCFELFRLGVCTDGMLADYDRINEKHWQALERGELTKPQVLEGRFREFFTKYGIPTAVIPEFNEEYQLRLGDTIVFFPNALETLETCKAAGIRQFAVTNGTKPAQVRKLALSGLDKLFDAVFISDEIGYEKPDPGFFAPVFAAAGNIPREHILIVGDSLTSDIPGGIAAGIRTCWYRRPGQVNRTGLVPDYEITDLKEAAAIALAAP